MQKGYSSIKHFESDIRATFAREEYPVQLVSDNEMRYLRRLIRFRERIHNTVSKREPQESSQVHSRLIYHFLNTVRQLDEDEITIEHRIHEVKSMIELLTSDKFHQHLNHIGFGKKNTPGDISGVYKISSSMVAPSVSGVISAAEALNPLGTRGVSQVGFSTPQQYNAAINDLLKYHPKFIPWKKVANFLSQFTLLVIKAKSTKKKLNISSPVITMMTFSWEHFNDPDKEVKTDMAVIGPQFHAALKSAKEEGVMDQFESCIYMLNAS